jgi:hypothetical protein
MRYQAVDRSSANIFWLASGVAVWGEPTLSRSESYMLFIRFDTSQIGWPAQIMFSKGAPATGFQLPVKLN